MITIQSDKEQTLLEALQRQGQLKSSTKARKWIKSGSVTVDDEQITIPSYKLKKGQAVKAASQSLDIRRPLKSYQRLDIIHEEESFLLVEKPAGIPVIAKDRKMDTLIGRLYQSRGEEQASKEDFFAITRLDKRESGLVLVAKSLESKNLLLQLGVQTRWYALVEGLLEHEDGRIEIPMKQNSIKLWVEAKSDGREAVTEYRVMKQGRGMTLLRLESKTSHKNQERAHLSMFGHPVVGDKRYGSSINDMKRIGMHLFAMKFEHPETGREVEYKTRVPKALLSQVKIHNK